jgi:ABC-type phosphate/phosphonate transport system substrate-binding protein
MRVDLLSSLPMYDFVELRAAHDAFWGVLARRLAAAGIPGVPRTLSRDLEIRGLWRAPSLLFGQGCEFPLAKSFADHVRLVATPMYSAAGCEGARYRSAIVVRAGARANELRAAFATLVDFRGQRCVINEPDSNSGMNLLRAAVAPLADGGRFFGSLVVSDSHLRSVEMVASGEADIASVDCVSFAHFRRLYPSVSGKLRVLGWTPSSPSLPFITSRSTSDATVHALRSALADAFADDALASARDELLLSGVDLEPKEGFVEVLALERGAVDAGYPTIR